MNLKSLEEEAKQSALAQVSLMLQRPDQLEKLDVYKKRSERKKAAVEAMLKTAVQSQLEGVKAGLSQLSAASEDIKTIKENLDEIYSMLGVFPHMREKLTKLKEENLKHGQYAAAMENLKQIFNVPDTIEKTYEHITDGKLLLAHKNLMELETARDDLMFEVHKLQTHSEYDKNLLKSYFSEVEKLAQELGKQLWYIFARALEAVRGTDPGPQQLVTAVRIVEREERIDKFYHERAPTTNNFMPPGRPRNWREKCFEVLNDVVRQRIEGNQLEDRTLNKLWLTRYLEICRRVVIEDLRVVKSGCSSCFPPEYEIYERYVRMYHLALSDRLREISSEELEKTELVELLSWIQLYSSDQMLGKPALQIDVQRILSDHPLLPKTTISQLADKFVDVTRRDIRNWLDKALNQEKDDWYDKKTKPEEDSSGCYYTALPTILFQIAEDQVTLAKTISTDIIPTIVNVHVEELLQFSTRYKAAFIAFKNKHFELRDRSRDQGEECFEQLQSFTHIMTAVANNCVMCIESTDKMKRYLKTAPDHEHIKSERTTSGALKQGLHVKIETLKDRWHQCSQAAVFSLLEEVNRDLGPHLSEILTKKWLGGGTSLDVICLTVKDYHKDHQRLKSHIMSMLMMELQYRILEEYLKAIESRRITFQNFEDRQSASEHLEHDGERLTELFTSSVPDQEEGVSRFELLTEILPGMVGILALRDKSLLSLEVSSFVRKFPDVTEAQLSGLMSLREDTSRADAKKVAQDILEQNRLRPKQQTAFTKLFRGNEFQQDDESLKVSGASGATASLLVNLARGVSSKNLPNEAKE